MSNEKKEPQKSGGSSVLMTVALIIAVCVLGFSGYNLYKIYSNYHKTDVEYDGLNDKYTKRKPASGVDGDRDPNLLSKYEDAEAPLEVDWESLRAINSDIVGWVYVEAVDISYPIVWREEDDDYYLHRSFEGQYLYAGAIFLEGLNRPDFADPISIVYGHNMKNGSMFAFLDKMKDQETYDKDPYFWILTPQGDYRYHIYSAFQTSPESEVYQLFAQRGQKFLAWEQKMKEMSVVENNVPLFEDDSTVILSTCETDHVHRNVVIGRCVSTIQPQRTSGLESYGTKGNTSSDLESESAMANSSGVVSGNQQSNGNQAFGDVNLGY